MEEFNVGKFEEEKLKGEKLDAETIIKKFEERGEEKKKEKTGNGNGEEEITPEEMGIIQNLIKDVSVEKAESVSRKMTAAVEALKKSPLYKDLSPKEIEDELKRVIEILRG